MERRTWSPKRHETHADRQWFVIDAEGKTLGRLASVVAATLRGKNKATYTPHMDMGDFVIVVNAEKVIVTGKKETQKFYYRHSQYPGGLKRRSVKEVRQRFPSRLVESAVRGMLPRNILGEQQLRKLKIYVGPTHPHESQQPTEMDIVGSGATRHSA